MRTRPENPVFEPSGNRSQRFVPFTRLFAHHRRVVSAPCRNSAAASHTQHSRWRSAGDRRDTDAQKKKMSTVFSVVRESIAGVFARRRVKYGAENVRHSAASKAPDLETTSRDTCREFSPRLVRRRFVRSAPCAATLRPTPVTKRSPHPNAKRSGSFSRGGGAINNYLSDLWFGRLVNN